jgi:hypothetical protein
MFVRSSAIETKADDHPSVICGPGREYRLAGLSEAWAFMNLMEKSLAGAGLLGCPSLTPMRHCVGTGLLPLLCELHVNL